MNRTTLHIPLFFSLIILLSIFGGCSTENAMEPQIKAAAAAVNIEISDSIRGDMLLTIGYPKDDEKVPLRAQAIVISDGKTRVCMGSCDVTTLNRRILDEIGHEVDSIYGIPFNNLMFGATHNHSVSYINNSAIKKAIIEAIGLANGKLNNAGDMDCYFALGDATIGQNSRLIMEDKSILGADFI